MINKLLSSDRMMNTSISNLAKELSEIGGESMSMTFRKNEDTPIAAVILVTGDRVQEYLDAIESVSENEEEE